MESIGQIGVQSHELSYSDMAPFLDELNKHSVQVQARVINYHGPSGGAREMFFELVATGGVVYLKGFIEALAADHAKALRIRLLETLKKGKASQRPDGFIPLRLHIGPVRFYFRKNIGEEVLASRLRASRDYLESLPDEALVNQTDQFSHGLWWDEDTESWKPVASGWAGDICPFDAG